MTAYNLKPPETLPSLAWQEVKEKRTLTVNSLLANYSDFPYPAQVFRLESWARLPGGRCRHEVRSGLTSLPASLASPARLQGCFG